MKSIVDIYQFRRATTDDMHAIHQVLLSAFTPYKRFYTRDAFHATVVSPEEIQARIKSDRYHVFVAIHNKKIVGTITMRRNPDKSYSICSMAVHPDMQNKGIGRCMLDEIYSLAQKEDIAMLSLESYDPLISAVHLYESYGFQRTGKVRDYYGIRIFKMVFLL